MAHRQNQYYQGYQGATNQPSPPPLPPGQIPLTRPSPPVRDNSRDQHPVAQQGYTSYGQPSPSSPYGQTPVPGPRARPPYPTYSYDDPPATPLHQYDYQHQTPTSPQHSYNPQHYAQAPASTSYSQPQSYGPPVPPRPFNVRPPQHQTYNPAAYSPAPGQYGSTPVAVNHRYGIVNGFQTQAQSQYGEHSYPSLSSPLQQQPLSPTFDSQQTPQYHPQSPARPLPFHRSPEAPTNPSRPFPAPSAQPAYSDLGSHYVTSTETPSESSQANVGRSGSDGQNTNESYSRSHSNLERIDTLGRHPQSRPLPGPPVDLEPDSAPTYTAVDEYGHYEFYGDELDQDQLYTELEDAVGLGSRSSADQARSAGSAEIRRSSNDTQSESHARKARPNGLRVSPDRNRHGDYSDDSDAEAAAGVQAMAIAAERERNAESSRQSQTSGGYAENNYEAGHHTPRTPQDLDGDEDDYGMFDISSYGGGIEVSMSYGGDPNLLVTSLPADDTSKLQAQHPSTSSKGSMVRSVDGYPVRSSSNTSRTDSSSLPPVAYVDQSCTGGFHDPSLYSRKLSFDDSSENVSIDGQTAAGADMSAGPPDLPYSLSVSMNRPLPPTPQQEEPRSSSSSIYSSTSPSLGYSTDLGMSSQPLSAISPHVPRSTSLWSHPSSPRTIEPLRAKTEGRRVAKVSTYNVDMPPDPLDMQTQAHVGLDIPSLPPGRRFHPSKLSQKDFDSCTEPWSFSGISSWLRRMAEGESELRERSVLDGLVALFTNKVPNMNITIAEMLAANTLAEMFRGDVLIHEEEWLRFGQGTVSGVLYQLTGQGCYSSFLHAKEIPGRCYAPHCQRMMKKVTLQAQQRPQTSDWATFYNLSKERLERATKKEIELQNNLYEIVTSEEAYMNQLYVLSTLYRDGLKNATPSVIALQKLPGFLQDVFGKVDAVKTANEEHLLPQLKYRQQEQGPWITGFSDIFRHWIRKAKVAYIEYAANFPNANFLMKREEGRNSMFVTFVDGVRNQKMSNRLEWSSFLRAPITRLQRYSLLLATVQKHMSPDDVAELSNLQLALDEIRAVTMECDSKVAESGRKADLFDLESRIILRPDMKGVELNLQQYGRKILFRGDLQRTGGSRFTWLQTHAVLLDNYLVLAKTVAPKDSSSGGIRYDISKMPIPMDLLVLESTNDDPVERTYKGISSVNPAMNEARHQRTNSNAMPGTLSHTTTNTSVNTIDSTTSSGKNMTITTVLTEGTNSIDSKILYPFRVRHLGRETYTLYANSTETRKAWCDKIVDAKTDHAASLFAQNAEPFKLRVMADSAFAYDTWSGGAKSVLIKGSPLARAVTEVEKMYDHKGRPGPMCRARVNCATEFVQPYGTQMVAVGTDYGVYVTEKGSPRGWSRAIPVLKVTQVAVLEQFNLFILISDKALIAYHLDVVCPPSGVPPSSDSVSKAPQKLSGARDVAFFVTGKMKERTLIFYKKGNLSSTFKILEPILQRAPEKKTRFFLTRGNTTSFREYDEFYIPTDCTALDVFTSTLSVATSKGLEILNLDKKTPFSVPDLKAPHVATIAQRLQGVPPLAMFRLNELEFLCVYEECAVYVNKHGDISRSVVMEFVGKAKSAALEGGYLILFDQDFVEIRNAQAGSLKQVIAGRDIRCLDNGRGRATAGEPAPGPSVKFAFQHPEQERTQIILELVLDETRRL